jgi:hypothetical protein
VPDNTRPPRNASSPSPQPTLLARTLMEAVAELARAKHITDYRVAYKTNAHNEHVVALIFPPQPP